MQVPYNDLAILIVRLVIGVVMFFHGFSKLQHWRELDHKWHFEWNLPAGAAPFVGVLQTIGGLLISVGIFSRWIALVLIATMVVATSVSLRILHEPFLSRPNEKGWDVNFLILGILVVLVLTGEGRFAVSSFLK